MSFRPNHSSPSSDGTDGPLDADPLQGVVTSLAFWICLFAAASIYALVVLSPKFVRWSEKQDEVTQNQHRLLTLQQEVIWWTRLTDQLERDEDFRRSLLSPQSRLTDTSKLVIPVDSTLRFDPTLADSADEAPAPQSSALLRVCEHVAGSLLLQILCLAVSAGLVIFSFSSLMESRPPRDLRSPSVIRQAVSSLLRRLTHIGNRYVSRRTLGRS